MIIRRGPASCKSWSGGIGLLQMIILRGQTLANDHPEGQASCKWSSRGADLLQMIIWRGWTLGNDHSEGPGLLQIMIRRDRPLAIDHLEGQASCKWSSRKWSSWSKKFSQTKMDQPAVLFIFQYLRYKTLLNMYYFPLFWLIWILSYLLYCQLILVFYGTQNKCFTPSMKNTGFYTKKC